MFKDRTDSWLEAFRALGNEFLALLRTELEVVSEDWKRAFRYLGIALLLFLIAAACFTVVVALLIRTSVEVIALWLPKWQAALVVAAGVLVVVAVAVAIGRWILQRKFHPLATTRQRLDDHLEWWQDRLLGAEERSLEEGDGDEDTDDAGPAEPATAKR